MQEANAKPNNLEPQTVDLASDKMFSGSGYDMA